MASQRHSANTPIDRNSTAYKEKVIGIEKEMIGI
jgi:hypothetical protein